MGYWSNSTERKLYQKEYCGRCVHWLYDDGTDTYGCPVWALHMLYNYSQPSLVQIFLDMLIPRDSYGNSKECKLFFEVEDPFMKNPFEKGE